MVIFVELNATLILIYRSMRINYIYNLDNIAERYKSAGLVSQLWYPAFFISFRFFNNL